MLVAVEGSTSRRCSMVRSVDCGLLVLDDRYYILPKQEL